MIKALSLLIIALAVPSHEQDTPVSPCPNVFSYEPPGTEPGRWYGVVNLSTDSTLHSLWLNIVLDSKADILGNWIGDVSTVDNIDFKIENTKMKIQPGPAVAVRFFVQYNPLNKTPKLLAIRLNGREICNAKTPHPVVDQPDTNNRPQRPSSSTSRPQTTDGRPGSRPEVRPDVRPDARPDIRPEDRPQTRPVNTGTRPSEDNTRPFYVRPQTPNAIPSDIAGGGERPVQQTVTQSSNSRPNDGYRLTTAPPFRQTTRRQDPNDFDVSTGDSEDTDEYFTGGQPLIVLPSGSGNKKKTNERQQGVCGKVVLNNPIPLVVNGTPTLEGQWPWQIALYQTQTVDNKYICGGTLVSHRHIITAGHCVTRKNSNRVVNHNTLTVYLGKHNLRTSVNGVAVRFVEKITVHPEYNASSFSRDLAILELREPVKYSEYIRPACLWPDNDVNLSNVIGKKGSVVGWGFDDTGVATEELSLVEMPVVDQETCIRSYSEFFVRFTSDYTYCAGYRDGTFNKRTGLRESTSVCNGDSGGGMVFNVDGTWFLRGLVSLSVARQNEYRCDPTHYVIFTDLAKFLPWIKQNIYDY